MKVEQFVALDGAIYCLEWSSYSPHWSYLSAIFTRLSGKTYKEIGEEIGKSAQSVRTLLLRLEKNKAYKKKGDSK